VERIRPTKHADFIVRHAAPFNGGPPLAALIDSPITPEELFFVRNHAPVPEIDLHTFRLSVGGLVGRPLELSLDDLARDFQHHTVEATLQCAGNRRDELIAVREIPGEVPWGAEAIGNARWGGVALRDVLAAASVSGDAKHAAFVGRDRAQKGNQTFSFGGSIPIEKANDPDVLLAFEMNGKPLPATHGRPLRVVVPGYIGARSVKWVTEIRAQPTPSDNYYQRKSYKLFPPTVSAETVDWDHGMMLGEVGPTAVLCLIDGGSPVKAGTVDLAGYAMGAGGRQVDGVEVSVDDGATWHPAKLNSGAPGTWYLWRIVVELAAGEREIIVRLQGTGSHQPDHPATGWNFKGYMNTAWHRTRLQVV
jgi:sulfite oxidase